MNTDKINTSESQLVKAVQSSIKQFFESLIVDYKSLMVKSVSELEIIHSEYYKIDNLQNNYNKHSIVEELKAKTLLFIQNIEFKEVIEGIISRIEKNNEKQIIRLSKSDFEILPTDTKTDLNIKKELRFKFNIGLKRRTIFYQKRWLHKVFQESIYKCFIDLSDIINIYDKTEVQQVDFSNLKASLEKETLDKLKMVYKRVSHIEEIVNSKYYRNGKKVRKLNQQIRKQKNKLSEAVDLFYNGLYINAYIDDLQILLKEEINKVQTDLGQLFQDYELGLNKKVEDINDDNFESISDDNINVENRVVIVDKSLKNIDFFLDGAIKSIQIKLEESNKNLRFQRSIKSFVSNRLLDTYSNGLESWKTNFVKLSNDIQNDWKILEFIDDDNENRKDILVKLKESIDDKKVKIGQSEYVLKTIINDFKGSLSEINIHSFIAYENLEDKKDSKFSFVNLLKQKFNNTKTAVVDFRYRLEKIIYSKQEDFFHEENRVRQFSLLNQNARIARFIEKLNLDNPILERIPNHYKQIYLGRHQAPSQALTNRANEFEIAYDALKTIQKSGGAIMVYGNFMSGKSYFCENVAKSILQQHKLFIINPRKENSRSDNGLINSLVKEIKISENEIDNYLSNDTSKSVFIFNDIELYADSENEKALNLLIEWVKKYSKNHYFIINCNTHYFRFIKNLTNIDQNLALNLYLPALSQIEFKEEFIKRANISGYDIQIVSNRKTISISKYLKNLYQITNGNIGIALQIWVSNIIRFDGKTIRLKTSEYAEFPEINDTDTTVLLKQFLFYKKMDYNMLKNIFGGDTINYKEIVDQLSNSGLISENNGIFIMNPIVYNYFVKYTEDLFSSHT